MRISLPSVTRVQGAIESPIMLNNWCVRVNPSTTSELARAKPRLCSVRCFARASLSADPGVLPCLGAGQIDFFNVCDMIIIDTNIYDTSCVLVGVRAHTQSTQGTAHAHGAAILTQQTPMFSPFWRNVTCQRVLWLAPRQWVLVRLLPVQLLLVRFDPAVCDAWRVLDVARFAVCGVFDLMIPRP
jgi:hypothetical protein